MQKITVSFETGDNVDPVALVRALNSLKPYNVQVAPPQYATLGEITLVAPETPASTEVPVSVGAPSVE